jgi:hypothetical protein
MLHDWPGRERGDERASAATDGITASAYSYRLDGTVLSDAALRQVTSFGVSEGVFELFGLPMAGGRTFGAEDYAASFGSRVILSPRLWRQMFGANPQIVGTTIRFGGGSALVVGIAPASFDVPRTFWCWPVARLWFSLSPSARRCRQRAGPRPSRRLKF